MDPGRRDLLKRSPLAIAAAATAVGRTVLAETPAIATEVMFNVRSYGATGDGKTVDTSAVNRAIEAVAAAGGGMLLFPAGTYVCFTIRLHSKVNLYLSPGCTILAVDSPKASEATSYKCLTSKSRRPTRTRARHSGWRTFTAPIFSPLPSRRKLTLRFAT
jgi:polygalacturonase